MSKKKALENRILNERARAVAAETHAELLEQRLAQVQAPPVAPPPPPTPPPPPNLLEQYRAMKKDPNANAYLAAQFLLQNQFEITELAAAERGERKTG